MLDYRTCSDSVTGILIGAAGLLLGLSRNEIGGEERKLTLPPRVIGGLGLCAFSASIQLPLVISPRTSLEGRVEGFRQIAEIRSSHFEFRINSSGHISDVLRAYYFDKGSFFGDPAVSDRDLVRLSYINWTKDIWEMIELSGRHTLWSFHNSESENDAGPWFLDAVGACLFFGGLIGWFSDQAAKVAPEA